MSQQRCGCVSIVGRDEMKEHGRIYQGCLVGKNWSTRKRGNPYVGDQKVDQNI